MEYEIEYKIKFVKDLKKIDRNTQKTILAKTEILKNDLTGNVKHLTNFSPEYRLRVGNYRILFEIEGDTIVVYRVLHRKESYK